jgi:uncharacterized protein
MPNLSRRLKQLEKELLALGEEVMLLEELDGLLAGILVCPEVIPPSEWLPVVWGQTEGEDNPVFDNLAHANKVLALLMGHYNNIAKQLFESPDRYAPLFPVDNRNGDILWEIWIEGFEKAVKLRPAAWQPLLDADIDTAKAMSGLLMLPDVARRDPSIPKIEIDALASVAPERISDWVVTVNEWRLESYDPKQGEGTAPPVMHGSPGKVGRNDPCPCGSGKKYKKCCGLN